jgi:hypothetical protein
MPRSSNSLPVVVRRDEADLLAVGLLRRAQADELGERAHLRASCEATQRQARARTRFFSDDAEELVTLVLGAVDAAAQHDAPVELDVDARVVAGRDAFAAELVREIQQALELQVAVADRARVGRAARRRTRRGSSG